MYAEHFPLENVRVAKMHFCIKCICNILCNKMYASNAFVTFCVTKCTHQMHFCIKCIFANQNVRRRQNAVFFALQKTKMLPLHFVYKMLESGKMHLMQKCIWCQNAFWQRNATLCKNAFLHHIFQRKMFSITFSFGKCDAKQNVRKRAAQKTPNTTFLQEISVFTKSKPKFSERKPNLANKFIIDLFSQKKKSLSFRKMK